MVRSCFVAVLLLVAANANDLAERTALGYEYLDCTQTSNCQVASYTCGGNLPWFVDCYGQSACQISTFTCRSQFVYIDCQGLSACQVSTFNIPDQHLYLSCTGTSSCDSAMTAACPGTSTNGVCDPNTCTRNYPNMPTCTCNPGYQGNGYDCVATGTSQSPSLSAGLVYQTMTASPTRTPAPAGWEYLDCTHTSNCQSGSYSCSGDLPWYVDCGGVSACQVATFTCPHQSIYIDCGGQSSCQIANIGQSDQGVFVSCTGPGSCGGSNMVSCSGTSTNGVCDASTCTRNYPQPPSCACNPDALGGEGWHCINPTPSPSSSRLPYQYTDCTHTSNCQVTELTCDGDRPWFVDCYGQSACQISTFSCRSQFVYIDCQGLSACQVSTFNVPDQHLYLSCTGTSSCDSATTAACPGTSTNGVCDPNTCTRNYPHMPTCTCNDGYQGNGYDCVATGTSQSPSLSAGLVYLTMTASPTRTPAPAGWEYLDCTQTSNCQSGPHSCNGDLPWYVDCRGVSACQVATFTCPHQPIYIDCGGQSSCQIANIGQSDAGVFVSCTGLASCGGSNMVTCDGTSTNGVCDANTCTREYPQPPSCTCTVSGGGNGWGNDCFRPTPTATASPLPYQLTDCTHTSNCQVTSLTCAGDQPWFVDCHGQSACQVSQFTCPNQFTYIDCGGLSSCQIATFNIGLNHFYLSCTGTSSCGGSNAPQCPGTITNGVCDPNTCTRNYPNMPTCTCNDGYQGDGYDCVPTGQSQSVSITKYFSQSGTASRSITPSESLSPSVSPSALAGWEKLGCTETSNCQVESHTCPGDMPWFVDCHGTSACQVSQFYCPTQFMYIDCGGEASCQIATIGQSSSPVYISCTGSGSCGGGDMVLCPGTSTNGVCDPNTCTRNYPNAPTCTCDEGYSGDGISCTGGGVQPSESSTESFTPTPSTSVSEPPSATPTKSPVYSVVWSATATSIQYQQTTIFTAALANNGIAPTPLKISFQNNGNRGTEYTLSVPLPLQCTIPAGQNSCSFSATNIMSSGTSSFTLYVLTAGAYTASPTSVTIHLYGVLPSVTPSRSPTISTSSTPTSSTTASLSATRSVTRVNTRTPTETPTPSKTYTSSRSPSKTSSTSRSLSATRTPTNTPTNAIVSVVQTGSILTGGLTGFLNATITTGPVTVDIVISYTLGGTTGLTRNTDYWTVPATGSTFTIPAGQTTAALVLTAAASPPDCSSVPAGSCKIRLSLTTITHGTFTALSATNPAFIIG